MVVDPGHGGKDPGALARFPGHAHEKTINLEIGRRVAKLLNDRGAKVTTSRDRDTYPERSDRADLAERLRVDLFVSIHCNSGPDDAIGAIVFVYKHASLQSQRAADCVVKALRRAGVECLGSSREDFFVLREHSRPAILIECGFLTNRDEAGRLNTPAYHDQLALAIVDGITAYFR